MDGFKNDGRNKPTVENNLMKWYNCVANYAPKAVKKRVSDIKEKIEIIF